MTEAFTSVAAAIQNRRSIKPAMMNGHKIPNAQVAALLELADWAPTHAYSEPWRFLVYESPSIFCSAHAHLYKANTPAADFNEGVYNNLLKQGDKASHIIVAIMKRSAAKLPVFEEISAVACAIDNILIGAASLNIASFWSTGGQALKPAMKEFLELEGEDQVMGVIYLGYADEHPAGKRNIPLEEKISWVK